MPNFLKKLLVNLGAPLLGGVIGGPGGAAIAHQLASEFGTDPEKPDELIAAIKADPNAAVKLKEIEANQKVDLQRLSTQQAIHEISAQTAQLQSVNETMREEYRTQGFFKSGWRPFYGWVTGIAIGLMLIGFTAIIIWVIIDNIKSAPLVINAIATYVAAISIILGAALAVLGVNINQRSRDKHVAAGHPPIGGLLGSLAKRIAGGS